MGGVEKLKTLIMDNYSDNQVLEGMKRSQSWAFYHFYDKNYVPMFSFVQKITGNRTESEDIVIVAINHCFSKVDEFTSLTGMRICTFVVCKTKALNYLRDSKTHSLIEKKILLQGEEAFYEPVPEKHFMKICRKAISGLPTKTREIAELHYLEGLNFVEIAATLKKNYNNTKAMGGFVRKKLREILLHK